MSGPFCLLHLYDYTLLAAYYKEIRKLLKLCRVRLIVHKPRSMKSLLNGFGTTYEKTVFFNLSFFNQWPCMYWWFTKHAKSKNRFMFTFHPSQYFVTMTSAEPLHLLRWQLFLAVTWNVRQMMESNNSCYLPVGAETDFKWWRMHWTYLVRGKGMANSIRTWY